MVELFERRWRARRTALSTIKMEYTPSGWTAPIAGSTRGLSPRCADAGRFPAEPLGRRDARRATEVTAAGRCRNPRNIPVVHPMKSTGICAPGRRRLGLFFTLAARAGLPAYALRFILDLNAFCINWSAIANISALRKANVTPRRYFARKPATDAPPSSHYRNGMMKTAVIGTMTGDAKKWRSFYAASIVPLYMSVWRTEQADEPANVVRSRLLTPGGIMATEYEDRRTVG